MGLKLLKNAINNINQCVHHHISEAKTPKNKLIKELLITLQDKEYIKSFKEEETVFICNFTKRLNKLIVIDPLLYPFNKKEIDKVNKQYSNLKGHLILTNSKNKIHCYDPSEKEGGKVICYVY